MLKRITVFIFIFILLLQSIAIADEVSTDDIVGETGILIDYISGEVLWEKDSDKRMHPASTTKMLTAIIILENHELDETFTIPNDFPIPKGSHIAIDYGETFTVEQLMYALLVRSANDAANALAIFHSGSIEAFSEVMNQKLIEIGVTDTNFTNPHGLTGSDHYSTAYDLAMIGRYCFQNSTFRDMVATSSYIIPPTNKKDEARNYIKSSNKFLNGVGSSNTMLYDGKNIEIKYDIVDGIKTGYTTEAGNVLVSTASKGNERYIAVVMNSNGSNTVFSDSRRLLDYGFEGFRRFEFISEGTFERTEILPGDKKLSINMIAASSLSKIIKNNVTIDDIQKEVRVLKNLTAPIAAGQKVGTISFYYQNKHLGTVDLVSEYAITESNLVSSLETAFVKYDENNEIDYFYYLGILLKLMISFIIYRAIITTYNLRKKKKRLEKMKAL